MGRHRPAGGRAALLMVLGLVACGERETLLQLDVRMPARTPSTLQIVVGASERRLAQPAKFPPPGQILGIDLLLPPELVGNQQVALLALDGRGCHLAFGGVEVVLAAGEKIRAPAVELEDFAEPVCDANGDAGVVDPERADMGEAEVDGGDDDAGAAPPDAGEDAPEPGRPDAAPGTPDAKVDGGPPPGDAAPKPDAAPPPKPDAAPPPKPDVAPPVDMGPPTPPPPPRCDAAGRCAAGLNCVANGICAAASTCAQIKTQKPGAPDGLYWFKVGTNQYQVYCDMQLGVSLCEPTEKEHQGRTRVTPIPFKFRSVLQANGTCRISAVRHAVDGYPLDQIVPKASVSTCAVFGFKPGDELFTVGASINRSCAYGSNPKYSACGFGGPDGRFGGRGFYKWGNTCTGCSPRRDGTPGFWKQGPVFASDIHWDMTGRVHQFCKVR